MDLRVRIFVDFWNFQLNWNAQIGAGTRIDWKQIPSVFTAAAGKCVQQTGATDRLVFEEARVYASADPSAGNDHKFRHWLTNFLDRQPGYRVSVRDRVKQRRGTRCPACHHEIDECPRCKSKIVGTVEKGVDTAIVTDLLSLAWEDGYNVAILVSSDADFIPAVERLQDKDFRVINACWRRLGNNLARVCWASFQIDELAPAISRPPDA